MHRGQHRGPGRATSENGQLWEAELQDEIRAVIRYVTTFSVKRKACERVLSEP